MFAGSAVMGGPSSWPKVPWRRADVQRAHRWRRRAGGTPADLVRLAGYRLGNGLDNQARGLLTTRMVYASLRTGLNQSRTAGGRLPKSPPNAPQAPPPP